MLWGVIPVILTFPLSWLGVRVFTSENLITALVGSVILFGVNLVQDTNFFKKVPAKEVLGRIALSILSFGAHRNFTAFAKDMNILAEGIKKGEIELVRGDIELLEQLVASANHLAHNPQCDVRPPEEARPVTAKEVTPPSKGF
ncbi:MAG: hypothetical protein A2942_00900 [Candidatus Lloydbacteria bacterium RIFCSPLOWO2_01_FULL_50_20]|uniref:Uncharacterized protein n=1 Tax=Candidatus Lloydbacteria bacterium RIFCSPLOWO2_01_FULL_50_20 TaxID=1798665 RepID=A0A1G2DFB2_9BACT|nr:MAG: hypothetical protein A2942_00900 [Candidatus Lloydbacteria bacterium RIFCSPLOWO2_01_FULL_50_20]